MNGPYIPISCDMHDRLLDAATLRRECELTIAGAPGDARRIRGVIADVYSRDGAEYLQLRDGTTLRLDEILEFDGQAVYPA